MGQWRILIIGVLLLVVPAVLAQNGAKPTEPAKPAATEKTSEKSTETKTEAAPAPGPDYSGNWLTWPKMTGDWGGVRTDLANKGITFDWDITQIMQENWHGGASTVHGLRYSGSSDLTLNLDTGKMGLWPGGNFLFHGEPKWGDGIGGKVGSLMPVNVDALKPIYGAGCDMALSEWIFSQVFFEGKLVFIGGKLDGSRAFDRNVFANDERTQFLNAAFRNNMVIPAFLPYTDIGAGLIVNPFDWLSIATAVADTDGRATTTGFETTFHGPANTTVIHEWAVKVKPFGLAGTQRVGFVWSSKDFPLLQPISPFKETGPLMMQLLGEKLFKKVGAYLPFDHAPDNVAVYYNFDQYLYTKPSDPTQGIGLFGRFGWARQNVNPVAHFYTLGAGGKGMVPTRDKDTYGLGYYFVDLSNDMPAGFHSEQGVECFYNIELTPWMHISPDLQIIVDPGGTSHRDVSLVGGLRFEMDL